MLDLAVGCGGGWLYSTHTQSGGCAPHCFRHSARLLCERLRPLSALKAARPSDTPDDPTPWKHLKLASAACVGQ